MEIIKMDGRKYPGDLEWGKKKYWQDRIIEIWSSRGIRGPAPIDDIEKVYVGNSSFPINEIYMTDGTMFYDELNSPAWAASKNNETIKKYYNNKK